MKAATQWCKYDPAFICSPCLGKWCLWTMEINGERNYFGGVLFKSDGKLLIGFDGFGNFEPNDTLYFARVLPLQE